MYKAQKSGGQGENNPCTPMFISASNLLPFTLQPAKGKKGKNQKSGGNPADAEAKGVAAARRIAVVPIRNGAVVGKIAEVTAA